MPVYLYIDGGSGKMNIHRRLQVCGTGLKYDEDAGAGWGLHTTLGHGSNGAVFFLLRSDKVCFAAPCTSHDT